MPETTYVQQAIATAKQNKQNADYNKYATDKFVNKMQQIMQQHIYNCTRSNLGF